MSRQSKSYWLQHDIDLENNHGLGGKWLCLTIWMLFLILLPDWDTRGMHLLNQWPRVRYLKLYTCLQVMRHVSAWWLPSACIELAAIYSHSPGRLFSVGPDCWINQRYGRDHYPVSVILKSEDLLSSSKWIWFFLIYHLVWGEGAQVSEVRPFHCESSYHIKTNDLMWGPSKTKYISISATHSGTWAMTNCGATGPVGPFWRWHQPGLHLICPCPAALDFGGS